MLLPKSAPQRVGRYRLLAPIARGGAATVYLARSEGIGGFARIVAVKLLHAHLLEDAASQAAKEFIEEAKLSARMQHPMIVPVMDVGQSEDGFYLVMDYIDGASLSEVLRKSGPIPRPIALRILSDVLEGLQAAHAAKDERGRDLDIVHRDFSPQNILVGTDGRSRLTDFGIARATTRAEYTRTGLVKGKVAYMSPEQAEGKPLDARTDVWAAGVVAWEVFAGRRIYPRMDPMPMMLRIINDAPPSLLSVCPTVEPALSNALERALHREPEGRISTAFELRSAISAATGGPSAMASPEEVGAFILSLNFERLDELRAIIQDASESRSVVPRPGPLADEASTRATVSPAESGTFATASTTMGASRSTTSMAKALGPNRKLWTGLAIAGVVLSAVGLALMFGSESPRKNPVELPAAAPLAARELAPPAAPVGETPPEKSGQRLRSEITIVANEPFSSVRLGKRTVVLPSPTMSASVQLVDDEELQPLVVEAWASGGRTARTTLGPDATAATITFSKIQPPVGRPSTPARKISAPAAKKPSSGLAASPY